MGVRLPPFQTLLDTHRDDVYRFLVAAVGPTDADDCFQETFISALRAYPRLEYNSNLRAWMLTIAHRKAIDSRRSHRRRPSPVAAVPEGRDNPAADPWGPSTAAEPELWEAVRRLPTKQRAAVTHRFVNDLSYEEIARIIGCSEDAARRNVHEGLKRLRGAWKA